MRWEDERYVRLYKRDTADWLALSFDAQALFCLLLRKVDLSGRLELGRHGPKAVAAVIGQVALWDRLGPALDELLKDGCVRIEAETLLVPNYVVAQEARMSPKLRQRLSRERKGDPPQQGVTPESETPESRDADATKRMQPVTPGAEVSRAVTPAFNQPLTSPYPAVPDSAAHGVTRGTDLWPPDLLARIQAACGKTDLDPDWQAFVGKTIRAGITGEQRIAGGTDFLDGGYAQSKSDPLSYCAAMITRSTGVQQTGAPQRVAATSGGSTRAAELEASTARFMAEKRAGEKAVEEQKKRGFKPPKFGHAPHPNGKP